MWCLKGRSSLGKPDELIIKTWQTASTEGIFSACISWLYICFPHCLFHYLIRVDLRISCCSLSCWVIIVNICFVLLCGILKKSWTYTCSLSTSFLGILLNIYVFIVNKLSGDFFALPWIGHDAASKPNIFQENILIILFPLRNLNKGNAWPFLEPQ